MWSRFFVSGLERDPLIWQQHDPWLILLALLLAIGSAMVALLMAGLARRAEDATTRQLALGSGALALGGGFWAMHFINMLAYSVCAQGRFDLGVTALSVLPGLAASWVALNMLSQEKIHLSRLLLSGLLVGAGIGAMHYVGMSAAALGPLMRYDPAGFLLSLVVAVLLAMLALWIRFGLGESRWRNPAITNLVAGTVMGLAIVGMHYIGIAALRFIGPTEIPPDEAYSVPVQISLSLAIAMVTMALSLLAIAINIGRRYHQLFLRVQLNESRLRAFFATAVDGIITIDGNGTVHSFNAAAEKMFGWKASEVIGRNVNMLMPEPYHSQHDGYLRHYLQTGEKRIIGVGREIEGLTKDGREVPMRLAVGQVQLPGMPMFIGFLTDISARRSMEEALRHSEEQFRTLVANIPGVTFRCHCDKDWSMLYLSDAVQELTGWPAAAFLTGRISFAQLQLDEEKSATNHAVIQAIAQNEAYHIEYRIHHRNGSIRWVAESARGVTDEQGKVQWIDGVMLDITETKARNAEFSSTVTAISRALAMVEYDLQGRVITANENFLELLGYTAEEVRNQPCTLFCTQDEAQSAEFSTRWQRLLQGEFESGEYLRLGKDGHKVWLKGYYNPIFNASGEVSKIIKLAADLTERHTMEQALRLAKEKAEQAAAARSSFLANMSHEIRTPMNAIIGFSEALLDSPLNAEQHQQMNTVVQAARSMLLLLNDILDTAKLEKGAMELELHDFSLRDLCQQIIATQSINAQKKQLPLVLDYPIEEPEFFRGDALRLQQVLVNLISNAIKFTERGEVCLHVSYRNAQLSLAVTDTGIGMSPAQLEKIFDPFTQADASTTRRFGGTGLGTTIAHQLVELMQGKITVSSEEGLGSTFCVTLPLAIGQAVAKTLLQQKIKLPALNILAVDDVATNLELLDILLTRDGHQLQLANSGEAAIQACMQQHFDLILMDLQMPGIDGFEASRRIRQLELEQKQVATPIIALSANVLEEDRQAARAVGMNGFADKPLNLPQLYGEITRLLKLEQHIMTVTEPPQASIQSVDIDWQQGTERWGEAATHQRAVHNFMQQHSKLIEELQQVINQPAALMALAHRLRGVAANLALNRLSKTLEQLETAARNQAQVDLKNIYATLPEIWQALQQAVQALSHPGPASTENDGSTLTAEQRALLFKAMSEARQALERGELPERALQTLQNHLSAARLSSLQTALDQFDFTLAMNQLQILHAELSAHSTQPFREKS